VEEVEPPLPLTTPLLLVGIGQIVPALACV
jgi:hypothetical protein